METTPASVHETFEPNRQVVQDLLHFDEIVLNLVTHNLGLGEKGSGVF